MRVVDMVTPPSKALARCRGEVPDGTAPSVYRIAGRAAGRGPASGEESLRPIRAFAGRREPRAGTPS
ncbi:MAG: hypothetical protein Fur0037_18650 [Planctomycetota bacterium]